jgi:plastocyanin
MIGLAAAAVLVACSDTDHPTAPATSDSDVSARFHGGAKNQRVLMKDKCDPATFDAATGDPNACVGNGHVTFQKFIAQLQKHQFVAAWRFDPHFLNVREGSTLTAINRGGEVHTFTEVEHFGGGIVPMLNDLSGNPTPAPECLALSPTDMIAAGGTFTTEPSEAGFEKYQCCIHPWMRAIVRVRGS